MSGPEPKLPVEKRRSEAPQSTTLPRTGVLLAIGAVVLVLLLCAAVLVLVSSQGGLIAGLANRMNLPGATATNSPGAVPSASAPVRAFTPTVSIVPGGAQSTTPLQTAGSPTAPLTETVAVPPGATQVPSPAATTARATTVPRTITAATATRPLASPSPNVAPGVYVTGMRIEPAQVMNGQNPRFYVTFLNSHTAPITYTWFIKVFEPEKRQSFGEEAKTGNAIPPGTSTLVSASNWKAPGEQPCRPFIARVFYYLPADNVVVEFSTPEGNSYSIDFKVCQ